jgi:hypothetical protein
VKPDTKALRAIEAKATPGPWKIKSGRVVATKIYDGFASAVEPDPNDQNLIVAARNNLIPLCDRVEELERRLADLDTAIDIAHEFDRRNEVAKARIERMRAALGGLAEADCSYGDNCPAFGSRHGRCVGCWARAALEDE